MGYFPFFINIEKKKCVIVGGGRVAYRKLIKLLPFGCSVTVIAPEIHSELYAAENVCIEKRAFDDSDLDGAFMVVSATDDRDLNRHIFELCTERGILVNTVDDLQNCSFLFPALATRSGVTVGIATSGEAPLYARHLREKTEQELQRDEELIVRLKKARKSGKEMFRTEQERKAALEEILQQYDTEGN